MRHAVVIEKNAGKDFSTSLPDLPGCVATGEATAEIGAEIREAIRFHSDGLKADGLPAPQPTSVAVSIDV